MLVLSVGNISLFKGSKYSYLAAQQRLPGVSGATNRGIIADRNMIPFTETETGAQNRYRENTVANHVIGYTNADGVGVSGIEKTMDSELAECGGAQAVLLDATGNEIPNFKTGSAYLDGQKTVKLTLDYHIQKITENVLDKFGITGGAVVMDVESFDVLAMASRPDFSQRQIGRYVASGGTELLNRCVSPYNAGSIFKIITAAAALEEGVMMPDAVHYCGGVERIEGMDFYCHKKDGHGHLTFEDAFSKSCNCVFYNTGKLLGSKKICEYAEKFGMGKDVLSGQLSESDGNLPKYISSSGQESANLSIGQGEIMITPLQAAKAVSIIAAKGVSKAVNIADSVVDSKGETIKDLREYNTERVISEDTASKIGVMMMKATTDGTGSNAKSEKVSIAGKTGSAETGWQTEDGYMVQGWFAGFFPYENPRYVLAVMTENGRGGNISCAPVFKEIAERIIEIR